MLRNLRESWLRSLPGQPHSIRVQIGNRLALFEAYVAVFTAINFDRFKDINVREILYQIANPIYPPLQICNSAN